MVLLRAAIAALLLCCAGALALCRWDAPLLGRAVALEHVEQGSDGDWSRLKPPLDRRSGARLYRLPTDGRGEIAAAPRCRRLGLWFMLNFPRLCGSAAAPVAATIRDGAVYFAAPAVPQPGYVLWLPARKLARAAAAICAGLAIALLPWLALLPAAYRRPAAGAVLPLFLAAAASAVIGVARPGAIASLSFGALLLAAVALLPRRPAAVGGALRGGKLVLLGFVLVEAAVSGLAASGALLPSTGINGMAKYLEAANPAEPVLLLVGSSYTVHAVDEALLSQLLSAGGHRVRALRLGVGGMSLIERYHYVEQYLRRSKRPPRIVLFEIGAYYDADPLRQFEHNLWSDRMVAATDFESARWALEWLRDPDGPKRGEALRQGAEILGHLALHLARAGFLSHSEWSAAVQPDPLDDPSDKAAHFEDAALRQTLDRAIDADEAAPAAPGSVPTRWVARLLATEMAAFRAHGATVFGFYQTPTQLGFDYAYGRRFCAAMRGFACVTADDRALLSTLAHDAEWYDRGHLFGPGRRVYTEWLARQIALRVVPP